MAELLTFRVESEAVTRALSDAMAALRAGATGSVLNPAFRKAAARYLAFIRRRFLAASAGDGTWPPLAKSTRLKRLRKISAGRLRQLVSATGAKTRAEAIQALADSLNFPILRDTNTLFAALSEGGPGSVLDFRPDGVTVQVNVFYAAFHQDPPVPGRPPQRKIFVQPEGDDLLGIETQLTLGVLSAFRSLGTTGPSPSEAL